MIRNVTISAVDGHSIFGVLRIPTETPAAIVQLNHGITADHTEWGYYDLVGDGLLGHNVASLAIDYRGHGRSTRPMTQLTLTGILLDISASWDFLLAKFNANNCKRVISGNSFGGGVSYLYGMTSKLVDAVILTMPVLSYVNDISRVNPAWQDELASGSVSYATHMIPSLLIDEFFYFDDVIRKTPASKPLTIIHGEADSDVPYSESQAFIERKGSGRVIGLPEMDHVWAAPGDLDRITEQSKINQRTAASETIDRILDYLR